MFVLFLLYQLPFSTRLSSVEGFPVGGVFGGEGGHERGFRVKLLLKEDEEGPQG